MKITIATAITAAAFIAAVLFNINAEHPVCKSGSIASLFTNCRVLQ